MAPYDVRWTRAAGKAMKSLPEDGRFEAAKVIEALANDAGSRDDLRTASSVVHRDAETKISIVYDRDTKRRALRITHVAQPEVRVAPRVFISYSHEDKRLFDQFRKHLWPLEDQQLLFFWNDTRIEAGRDWLVEIRTALQRARAILCLLSPDFLVSPFIKEEEVGAALRRSGKERCLLLWIQLRACEYEAPPFGRIQALFKPDPSLAELTLPKRDRAFKEIAKRVRKVLEY